MAPATIAAVSAARAAQQALGCGHWLPMLALQALQRGNWTALMETLSGYLAYMANDSVSMRRHCGHW